MLKGSEPMSTPGFTTITVVDCTDNPSCCEGSCSPEDIPKNSSFMIVNSSQIEKSQILRNIATNEKKTNDSHQSANVRLSINKLINPDENTSRQNDTSRQNEMESSPQKYVRLSPGSDSLNLDHRVIAFISRDNVSQLDFIDDIALGPRHLQPMFIERTLNKSGSSYIYDVTLLIGINNPCNDITIAGVNVHIIIDTRHNIRLTKFDRHKYPPSAVKIYSMGAIHKISFIDIQKGLPQMKCLHVTSMFFGDHVDRLKCIAAVNEVCKERALVMRQYGSPLMQSKKLTLS